MCDKAVNRSFFVFDSFPNQCKTPEMCDSRFWRSYLIAYWPDKYKTQRMCDEAVNDSLAALKLPDWFGAS